MNPKNDPIVFLAGGPGGSGLLEQSMASRWNAARDVIFISQRGTLKAEPFLSCPEIDEFTSRSIYLVMAEPATSDMSAAATRACRDRHARAGWDLSAYNTTENAADVADLRSAMGIHEWNVYGVSYGTNLALQLLRDHPEGIRAMVLDSVVPPQITSVQVDWAAAGFHALFDACADQNSRRTAFPNAQAEFTRLVADLAAHPRTVSVDDPESGRSVGVIVDDGVVLVSVLVTAGAHGHGGDFEREPDGHSHPESRRLWIWTMHHSDPPRGTAAKYCTGAFERSCVLHYSFRLDGASFGALFPQAPD